jgi:hypothetical protein
MILQEVLGTMTALNSHGVHIPASPADNRGQDWLWSGIIGSLTSHDNWLQLHAVLGIFLFGGSIAVFVAALRLGQKVIRGASAVAMVAIAVSGIAGAAASSGGSGADILAMSGCAAISLAAYVVVLGLL